MRGISGFLFNSSLALILFQVTSCSPDLPTEVANEYQLLPEKVDYNIHVKPVLSDKCFKCHGPDENKRKAGLRLDMDSSAFADLPEDPGNVAIDPGNVSNSQIYHRILSNDPEFRMPPPEAHLTLSDREKAVLIKWISNGAEYKPHWAFINPEKAKVPAVQSEDWIVNPIDNFILHQLEEKGIKPSARADKELLLRRVSLDLTGLPPNPEEIDQFLNDDSPTAYETQVDRLLASPHFGEKMTTGWLDLARFADSHGYTVDRLREMSPYRDWVIDAFNKNLPYDKFIHWQVAGDLIPNRTKEMIIATAFNRNHPQNMEGGIIEEEFQSEYVIDRTNTLGEAFLGLSVGCARCHDHKFDPISQRNYYELFSFFNNINEAGQISWDDATPTPSILLPTNEQEKIIQFISKNIFGHEKKVEDTERKAEKDFDQWLHSEAYREIATNKIPFMGLQGQYTFDKSSLQGTTGPVGKMKQAFGEAGGAPQFESERDGKSLLLNGDVWLDLADLGIFRKADPFTICIRAYLPEDLHEGVIFHKSNSERLYNFRGYHLYLKDDRLEVSLAHTAPSNAITKLTIQRVPKNSWIDLAMTYDGSGRADGLKLFLNGQEMDTKTTMDQLYKDILFNSGAQPGLQIGAWNRGLGLKGAKADDILVYDRALTKLEIEIVTATSKSFAWKFKKHDALSADEIKRLRSYYLSVLNRENIGAKKELQKIRNTLADSTEHIKELMVMQEMPERRRAYILKRGEYNALGEEVFPNTPEAILPFPKNLPKNRYGLAQWLTNPDHPLTSRVAVNRYWQNFFGKGLVTTAEDFGNQGESPSHPDLLDWLAVTFRESGWDIKKLCKLIAMSSTYTQDSRTTQAILEIDPENKLLSHGPALRLTAEMIRDNALAASGLLNKTIGGKSVKPYQPDGLWEINSMKYKPDSGADVYRRSLYVLIKRSVPNPTLSTFDAPSRSYCVVRRQITNTPLQALVGLNDPTFVEAAKVLGVTMARAENPRKGIVDAFRRLTGRNPFEKELNILTELYDQEFKKFKASPQKMKGWLSAGQYVVEKELDPVLVAANAVVASTILNSDATITKR